MRLDEYDQNVFINCPFDSAYAPIFEAIVFTVNDAGFRSICARERLDSSELRLKKIMKMIAASRFSIHDLSRTTLDDAHGLPRFNMPLELGIDLGCKEFKRKCANKSMLIFDSEQYRFRKFISDLSGQDIQQHGDDVKSAIAGVRNWLRSESDKTEIASGAVIHGRYEAFRRELPEICSQLHLDVNNLTFVDFSYTIARWIERHP